MKRVAYMAATISVITLLVALYHLSLSDHALATKLIETKLGGQAWRWPLFLPGLGIVVSVVIAVALRKPIRLHMNSKSDAKHSATTMMCVLFGPIIFLTSQLTLLALDMGILTKAGALKPFFGLVLMYFLLLGNYITTTRRTTGNGFRTPWSLKDDKIWEKTQRFCGRGIFTIALINMGALFILPAKQVWVIFLSALIGWKIIAFIYSWVSWRQLLRERSGISLT